MGGAVTCTTGNINMPPKLASGRVNAKGKTAVSAGVQNCRPAAVRIKEVVLVVVSVQWIYIICRCAVCQCV